MKIKSILKNGISSAMEYIFPLLGTWILWILTCWIPYLNIGTTIALFTLPAKMSRGEEISPTEIFNPKYRYNMGNFFLIIGFMFTGLLFGFAFLIIPGLVLTYSWYIAILLLVDKDLNPMQAIHLSNALTNGHKWTIFLSLFVFAVIAFVAYSIISILLLFGGFFIRVLIIIIFFSVYKSIVMGIQSEIYKQLVEGNSEKNGLINEQG